MLNDYDKLCSQMCRNNKCTTKGITARLVTTTKYNTKPSMK